MEVDCYVRVLPKKLGQERRDPTGAKEKRRGQFYKTPRST
jgi:hypothetical protein